MWRAPFAALLEVVAGLGEGCWAPRVDKNQGEVAEFGYRLYHGRVFRRYIVKRIAIEPGEQATLDQGCWRRWIFVTSDHTRSAAQLESEHRNRFRAVGCTILLGLVVMAAVVYGLAYVAGKGAKRGSR